MTKFTKTKKFTGTCTGKTLATIAWQAGASIALVEAMDLLNKTNGFYDTYTTSTSSSTAYKLCTTFKNSWGGDIKISVTVPEGIGYFEIEWDGGTRADGSERLPLVDDSKTMDELGADLIVEIERYANVASTMQHIALG